MSVVNTVLAQLMTGFCAAAARNRVVLPMIQAVRIPPPEPPVTNRLSASTKPSAIAASTVLMRSS
ncbi:hypothetical protein D3C83_156620 [compost metagenome]